MTYSILAHDPSTGELGAAAATGNLAVGAWVLFAEAGAGLASTQGLSVSTLWGHAALRKLSDGVEPDGIVADIVAGDAGAASRQLIVMNMDGIAAGWTGRDNRPARGHEIGPGLAVAGNWLAGEFVLPELKAGFMDGDGSLADRLIAALKAASRAGGDCRGLQSAAMKIIARDRPPVDLRVDYSDTPLRDISELYRRTKSGDYREFLSRLPTCESSDRC